MFTVQPGFPIGGAEGTTDYGYGWDVELTPVVNGNIKSSLNIKPTKMPMIISQEAPAVVLLEDQNKIHLDQIWFKVGDKTVVYDIATQTFTEQ